VPSAAVPFLARRGARAHLGRIAITAMSIVVGVSFTSGSLILTDSFGVAFDRLIADLDRGIDLRVRGATAFGRGGGGDPVPSTLADDIAAIPGVQRVEPNVDASVVLLDGNGEPVPARRIQLGVSWTGTADIGGRVLVDGRPPVGPEEAALDDVTARRVGLAVGDRIDVATAIGVRSFTMVGTTGLVSNPGDSFGATIIAFDPATAQTVLDSEGWFDSIDLAVDRSLAQVDDVAASIAAILPEGAEVVPGSVVREESQRRVDDSVALVRWLLIGFAIVALFVSALLIDNTFRIITSQRLRELALLRAVGASVRQVRRIVIAEALGVALLGSAIGVIGGVGVARLLTVLFNAAGAAFPRVATVLDPGSVAVSVAVGVGVTLASVLVPAARAGRTAPLAAAVPEPPEGSAAARHLSRRRNSIGAVLIIVGHLVFAVGVFRPSSSRPRLIAVVAVGGFTVLVGAAVVAAGLAPTVCRLVGSPIARFGGVSGRLGAGNATRLPRRTASAASALMIGLALVSGVSVVGVSLSRGLAERLDDSFDADFVVTGSTPRGIPPLLAERIAELPEIVAASGFRSGVVEVAGVARPVAAIDAGALTSLVDLSIVAGASDGLGVDAAGIGGVLVQQRPAEELGLTVGDLVDVRWRNGGVGRLQVRGVFTDSVAVNANWLVDLAVFRAANPASTADVLAIARVADDVPQEQARAAIDRVLADFPQVEVQDRLEFRRDQADRLAQFLVLVYSLLGFSAAIAVLGITNTLSLSVLERTQEIGLLRAVGASRLQIAAAVVFEAVVVALFGAVLGIVVGVSLGSTAAAAMDPIGVTSVVVPWVTIGAVVAISIAAGVLAAVLPARRAARLPVLAAVAR
jgi:putative ABC transport system permease protein